MQREILFSTPKQVDPLTIKTGAVISYCYFHDDSVVVYMDGGRLSETILLEGLTPQQRRSVEDFFEVLKSLTQDEVENATSKTRVRQNAERSNQARD